MIIKVISLNMLWGGELMPALVSFLKKEQADIVALQEVHDGHDKTDLPKYRSMDVLKAELNYPFSSFSQTYMVNQPPGPTPLGNAVLSRFEIKSTKEYFFVNADRDIYDDVPEQWPIYPRSLQHCQLDTPASILNVFNMHGVWDLNGENDSPERQHMGDTILQASKDLNKVILLGDTNASQANPIFKRLKARFYDAFDGSLTTTFNMRRKDNPDYAKAAVDIIYVSPDIKVISASCPDVDISDHLPLVASLDIA